ncbi:MAG: hypothetical protein U5K37_12940 [Natrialbaceae archaeon]|nr:hypothetical protein [Natrialbaceae archaeon]
MAALAPRSDLNAGLVDHADGSGRLNRLEGQPRAGRPRRLRTPSSPLAVGAEDPDRYGGGSSPGARWSSSIATPLTVDGDSDAGRRTLVP